MKLKTFTGKSQKEETNFLTLSQESDGVVVAVCDVDGNLMDGGKLIRFTNDGWFYRITGVSPGWLFYRDAEGRIKEGPL